MDCLKCGIGLDADGTCPTCVNFADDEDEDERRKSRALSAIIRSARDLNCHWTEVDGAVAQAEEVGLTGEKIEQAIAYSNFRYEDPIMVLSDEQDGIMSRLTDRGLVFYRCESGPFRQGFTIYKPTSVPGNFRLDYTYSIGDLDGDGDSSDAPNAWLYPEPGDLWVFMVSTYSGGVGPGDYFKRHQGLDPAVADVIDYYFGDPKRMTPPLLVSREERLRKKAEAKGEAS